MEERIDPWRRMTDSSPKGKLTGNSPKRSKLETSSRDIISDMSQEEAPILSDANVDNVANQIIESIVSSLYSNNDLVID